MPRKRNKVRMHRAAQSNSWKQDIDYFHALPDKAKRYLRKFLKELYGTATYSEKSDIMAVHIRVDLDPAPPVAKKRKK